jgi:hypothetical protein
MLNRHSLTLVPKFFFQWQGTSLRSTPLPLRSAEGGCHVGSSIVIPQLWEKGFFLSGKERRFAPHHSPSSPRRGDVMSDPRSSFLNFGSKFFFSVARNVASLHTTPPPLRGGACHVGPLTFAPQLWEKVFFLLARNVASLHNTVPSAPRRVRSCWTLDRRSSTLGEGFFFSGKERRFAS